MRRTAIVTLATGLVLVALTAGCGVQAGGTGGGSHHGGPGSKDGTPSPQPGGTRAASTKCVHPRGGSERTTITLTNSANNKVLCVLKGVGVFVALHGTPKAMWAAVASSSAALQPRPNGALSLPVGVTGAFFVATAPGTAKLTSTLRPCPAKPRTHAAAPCLKLIKFSVTIKVPS
ncbi:MAG TPA: hypothetical protein VFI65_34010 [Streptosporangiaceae bacterium]|nr:hypothetical protein [Streptosporangiaceae bacterium]